MKKIAVITSGEGKSARHLASLFNEGNRIRVEMIIEDPDFDEKDYATLFAEKGVDLLAFDGFEKDLPEDIAKAYEGRTVVLSSPENAPREVVAAFSRIDESKEADSEATLVSRPDNVGKVEKSVDEEWAETLRLNYDPSRLRQTPPPMPGERPLPPASPYERRQGSNPAPDAVFNQPVRSNTPDEPLPPTYLIWAVIVTVICCFVPGIVAIIYSSQVTSRYVAGDIEGAKRASRNTEIWIIVSFVLGVLSATLYLPIMLIS